MTQFCSRPLRKLECGTVTSQHSRTASTGSALPLLTMPLQLVVPIGLLIAPQSAGAQETGRDKMLKEMHHLMQATQVTLILPEQPIHALLRSEPVVAYTDETRDIKTSSLWVWMHDDVPVAFQKIEDNHFRGAKPFWTFCFATCGTVPIETNWSKRPSAFVSEPTLFHVVPDESEPAPNAVRRSLQFRALSKRFVVTAGANNNRNDLRLLPRPLLEYSSPKNGVVAGAVFAHALGTNPDVLIAIQIESRAGQTKWTYAPVRMTSAAVQVTLDGDEVFNQPPCKSGDHDRWCFFFASK